MPAQTLQHRTSPVSAGDTVQDFTLMDQDRKEWTLSAAAKKGDVVLSLFPFAFTGVCGTENKCITAEMASWQKKGAQVVGISCDSMFALKEWAAKEGFKHTLLSDQHREVCKSLGMYWPDMNTAARGTVIIGKSSDGTLKVKWAQTREVPKAMNWDELLGKIA